VIQSGIPIINVNHNCASGSTALFLARQAVLSRQVECALAFGFEEMPPGALGSHWSDRKIPFELCEPVLQQFNAPQSPIAFRTFGATGRHYMNKYHVGVDIFAKVAEKSRCHALYNPYSIFLTPLTYQQVFDGKVIYDNYLTRLMACPPTYGAAATIVCSEQFARQKGITSKAKIFAQVLATDMLPSW
jgi:sterol carrier protein 2